MKKIILSVIFSLAVSICAFGQAKEITREQYYKTYREAFKKFSETPSRRTTSKEEYYKDGKSESLMETITENISPDKFRYVVIRTSDKGTNKTEFIRIGEKHYCRRNDGEWQNSKGGCSTGGGKGISNIVSSQFSVETVKEAGKTAKIYRQYTLYKNKDTNGKEVLWYWEERLWISEDSKFLRQESESGQKETNQVRSKEATTYEYNPKDLKIEAPIKP